MYARRASDTAKRAHALAEKQEQRSLERSNVQWTPQFRREDDVVFLKKHGSDVAHDIRITVEIGDDVVVETWESSARPLFTPRVELKGYAGRRRAYETGAPTLPYWEPCRVTIEWATPLGVQKSQEWRIDVTDDLNWGD